jgi:phage terminase large subunit-like protein
MVNGPSGILTLSPDYRKPNYLPSKRQLRWEDGTVCNLYSGESVDSLRGLSTSHIWCDELAKYRYIEEAVEQIDYTLREGDSQQLLVTTTPRPHPVIKEYKEKAQTTDYVEMFRGTSFENPELGDRFQRKLQAAKDTRLGRQEIFGEILDDSVGELWSYSDISTTDPEDVPELKRIVVGLDPSVSNDEGDEAGIVVVGEGVDGVAYVLADLSGQYTTSEWAAVVVAAYRGSLSTVKDLCDCEGNRRLQEVAHMEYPYPPADKIHAERNQGGSLVEQQLRTLDHRIPYDSTHTTRPKDVRAEPVHSLYQAGKVKHVGQLPDLEDQLVEFMRDGQSPDRVDAMVYAVNKLLLVEKQSRKDAFSKILDSF